VYVECVSLSAVRVVYFSLLLRYRIVGIDDNDCSG
jgi:hypothetical protein